jgi:hypothetical protein
MILQKLLETGIAKAFEGLVGVSAPPVFGQILGEMLDPLGQATEELATKIIKDIPSAARISEMIRGKPAAPTDFEELEEKFTEVVGRPPLPARPGTEPTSFDELEARFRAMQRAEENGSGALFAPGPFGSGQKKSYGQWEVKLTKN